MCSLPGECLCLMPLAPNIFIIGLSFERPYLIKGLNLMIAKSADFDADLANFTDFADFNVDYADFHADFTNFGLKLVKLTISFHSTVRIQGGDIKFFLKICGFYGNLQNPWILPKSAVFQKIGGFPHSHLRFQQGNICNSQTKDHLPREVTPIFLDERTQRGIIL